MRDLLLGKTEISLANQFKANKSHLEAVLPNFRYFSQIKNEKTCLIQT